MNEFGYKSWSWENSYFDNSLKQIFCQAKKYYFNFRSTFSLVETDSFCCLYKRVDSENNHNNFKTLKLSIETIIKNTEMLKFVPHHLKTKKSCKNAGKKLLLVI